MSITQPNPSPDLQEDDLTQKQNFQDIISSLPKEVAWLSPSSQNYQYQGFWYFKDQVQAILTCQNHFRARDSDILLVTNPKSGTTWLKALLYTLLNRPTWPLGQDQDHPLRTKNPHDLVPYLELNFYANNQVPDLTGLSPPRIFATHLPINSLPRSVFETGCKVVYLCRNPKDTFISLWHFINRARLQEDGELPLEEAFDKFCRGVSLYGPFWDHVLGYWRFSLENPKKVLFLKFEDLKEQPVLHLKRLAEFCECPFSIQEENEGVVEEILKLCSFENLSNLAVNKNGKAFSGRSNKIWFRKGEVGDWVNYLSPEMVENFDKITEEKLHCWGLKF